MAQLNMRKICNIDDNIYQIKGNMAAKIISAA
jgi:hypothetical protein